MNTSNEIDELKRVKEEFQLEMVSGGELSSLRQQFLNDAIGLLNLAMDFDDQEVKPESKF